MAEALEQAVETAEPDTNAEPLAAQGAGDPAPVSGTSGTAEAKTEAEAEAEGSSTEDPGSQNSAEQKNSKDIGALFEDQDPEPALDLTPATLHGRFDITPMSPRPDLNTPSALAYSVEDRREANRSLFALICPSNIPTNVELMTKLRASSSHGLLSIVDFGPVFWSAAGEKCMAIVYEVPLGGRFIDSFGTDTVHLNEYEISPKFVEQVLPAIQLLSTLGQAHRSIRLDNLYYMDKECSVLVLGDCVSAPPGYNQPIIYESLERSITMPSGRGAGNVLDDIYALGICMVFLLLHKNPAEKKSDDEVIIGKCDEGTYKFLCDMERIPLPLIEVIRGILADEPSERWELDAIERWLAGQKAHVIQRKPLLASKTGFKFNDKKYHSPRSLAYAFSKNIQDGVKCVKGSKLEAWLSKTLNRPDIAEDISGLIALSKAHDTKPDGSGDVLISKVCMRLDPLGPIRFKNFSFMLDGFKDAFAMEYLHSGGFQIQGQILARNLITYWAASQPVQNSEIGRHLKTFNSLRTFAKTPSMGYGMERCLYELNRSLSCQGEYLKQQSVHNIDALMPALNNISETVDHQLHPIDKHIAAFIATHFPQDTHTQFKSLNSTQEHTQMVGLLSLYALIQWKQDHKNLFGLTTWFGSLLRPVIETYHSRTTQNTIDQEIPSMVRQGSLPDLFDLIDSPERRNLDDLTFKQAQYQFSKAEAEIQATVGDDVDQEQVAQESGETATAMFAVIACMIATCIIIFVMMM